MHVLPGSTSDKRQVFKAGCEDPIQRKRRSKVEQSRSPRRDVDNERSQGSVTNTRAKEEEEESEKEEEEVDLKLTICTISKNMDNA